MWVGFIWLRIGQVAGFCKGGDKHCGSLKDGEFLD
jgi:hypothetical protein